MKGELDIYFEFKTIKELIGECHREQKLYIMASINRVEENTYDFSPDDWINYLTPLVDSALGEADEGINNEHLFQKYILAGVLVGQGMSPQEAISQVDMWENTGISKLLDASMRNNK